MATPIVDLTPEIRKAQRELAAELPLIKDRLMRLGLVLTHHAMDGPLRIIGYEIAALESGTWPDSAIPKGDVL